jgi:DNA-binding LytR/AlgR family response regulator
MVSAADDYFFVKTEFRLEKVGFDEILYIEGMGDYLRIVTPQKRIMTLQNFKKMEEILSPTRFCRVHKSYIVAMDKIESIERNRIRMAGQLIPVSDSYRKVFFGMLDRKKLE